jgi:hypothetical protein
MILPWLHTPYINLSHVAARLYGAQSRLHTYKLQKKLSGVMPLEGWELEKLAQIKQEVFRELHGGPHASLG